jgi:hypothetical protein
MSSVSDAFAALKNVMLMQERIDGLRNDITKNTIDLSRLTDRVFDLDKRVVRIETVIEMTGRQAAQQPRIEG